MDLLIIICLFVFGTLFGSFGSVLVWRLRGEIDKDTIRGVLIGNSQCPKCNTRLGVLDLIPIFSYIFTNGKCRHCGNGISLYYPILELFTGLVFIFSYWLTYTYLGFISFTDIAFWGNLIFFCFINWILVLFIMQDILFFELNGLIWLISILIIIAVKFFGLNGDYFVSFIGAVSLFSLFYGIYIFSKRYVKFRFGLENTEGFGGGDVMVAFWIGLLFDIVFKINQIDFSVINMISISLYYLVLSCIGGLIFSGVSYLIYGGKQGKSIPFLPAMVIGFWIILIFGGNFINLF